MSVVLAQEPRLVHSVPGRVRVHLPELSVQNQRDLENTLRHQPGIQSVQANPDTGNVLIRFSAGLTDGRTVLGMVSAAARRPGSASRNGHRNGISPVPLPASAPPPAVEEREGQTRRARIAVRGLDRDPGTARRVVEHLERLPGVKARANVLTGRVLVEWTSHQLDIEDLVSEVANIELPDMPGEDRPTHPLDPAPLQQSATRLTASVLGLSLLAAQRLSGQPPLAGGPALSYAGGMIHIAQAFPPLRNGLRSLVGRDAAILLLGLPDILLSALTGSPLSLALAAATSLRLLTEVTARRTAWRRYEERLADVASAQSGATVRLESGERTPLTARVMEGQGTASGQNGLPLPVMPGVTVPAGARLSGGPFVLELTESKAWTPTPRPAPLAPTLYDRYQQATGIVSLVFAAGLGIITRSPSQAFAALLLVNPRPALIGREGANLGAAARVLRAGVTVVGTRPDRSVRRPDFLILDSPRLLTNGLELTALLPLTEAREAAELQSLAAGIDAAAGSPWGATFPPAGRAEASDGRFDGSVASATIEGACWTLGPVDQPELGSTLARLSERGDFLLALGRDGNDGPLAILALRPRLVAGVAAFVQTCRRHTVQIILRVDEDSPTAQAVARRVGLTLTVASDMAAVRQRQASGARVAFVSDSADAAEAFAACDLGVGLSSGRSSRFPARADLLAPDLDGLTAIIESGARREAAVLDSLGLSLVSNIAGAFLGVRGGVGIETASRVVYVAALAAMADGWARLRGGERPQSVTARLVDPKPERWGRRSAEDTLAALGVTPQGLTTAQALERRRTAPKPLRRNVVLDAIWDQMRSPLIGILAAGAGLSLFLGSPLDFALIAGTILVNVAVGAWQERQAGQATLALEQLGRATATVVRDGMVTEIPAGEVVPGDILLLASGDRVAADARMLESSALEVDEAALTGESLPVFKVPDGGVDTSRIVLEGSDVTTGKGRAVVVAVGKDTRLGATAAALALDDSEQSPLGLRLGRLMKQFLPLAGIGGGLVVGVGLLRGQPLLPQLAVGATIALASVPEGLPLLAGMGEAAVARRLAGHNALVRRLSAVEALGRVDVACTDKTGTLTEGKLALGLVASPNTEAAMPGDLPADLRPVLRAAAWASPSLDAPDFDSHPTDVAVVRGALDAGLGAEIGQERMAEAPFDPARAFHATLTREALAVKGAPEAVTPRCSHVHRSGKNVLLDVAGRESLLQQAHDLAGRGLRILMVAQGSPDTAVSDPQGLTALGFVGIRDPLRPTVHAAVRRCHEAGIHVLMLTGDHPATARAIAREAGLLDDGRDVLTSADIAHLQNSELHARLDRAAVIARATPLDKLRIIESFQRHGHTVAMTGDGVNDAPALRLADVGVAMGKGGTEVARQAAAVVLADDDFATLVEALVEGRGFWRNMRRALGLLLGGNLGELGLVVGASLLGLASPLTTRQILAVNLITDALPALSVALQRPENRHLASLAREGTSALDTPLRNDVLRRGAATTVPALAAFALTLAISGLPQARTVAFASIVATQLAQTLKAGWIEGGLTPSVFGAVGASAAFLVAAITIPALRTVLTLTVPTPFSVALIGVGAVVAMVAGGTSSAPTNDVKSGLKIVPSPLPRPRALLPAPRKLLVAPSA